MKTRIQKRRNYVKKNMDDFHKPKVHERGDQKKKTKKIPKQDIDNYDMYSYGV